MNFQIREYRQEDYPACEDLVNRAWTFDELYKPERYSALAKKIYTKGAELESTYKSVAVCDDQVIGFIFGLNQHLVKRRLHLYFRIKMIKEIIAVKPQSPPGKMELLKALADHEKNRSSLVDSARSELTLFVIAEHWQRKGVGSRLWSGFLNDCKQSGVTRIVVETNKKGASRFYEKIGFTHLGNFYSPLHEIATPGGQACMYQYDCDHQ